MPTSNSRSLPLYKNGKHSVQNPTGATCTDFVPDWLFLALKGLRFVSHPFLKRFQKQKKLYL